MKVGRSVYENGRRERWTSREDPTRQPFASPFASTELRVERGSYGRAARRSAVHCSKQLVDNSHVLGHISPLLGRVDYAPVLCGTGPGRRLRVRPATDRRSFMDAENRLADSPWVQRVPSLSYEPPTVSEEPLDAGSSYVSPASNRSSTSSPSPGTLSLGSGPIE